MEPVNRKYMHRLVILLTSHRSTHHVVMEFDLSKRLNKGKTTFSYLLK
jgi:hypothetical protein